jgi:ancient ubiquitous protein 1
MILAAFIFHDLSTVRKFILRMMCNILGVIVREDFSETKEKALPVLVANDITPLDHLAFHVTSGCVSPKGKELPGWLSWALGYEDLGIDHGFDVLTTYVRSNTASSGPVPILLQPEGCRTNGRVGLMKFQNDYFNEVTKVQPVAIQIWRPPTGPISPCVLGSSCWTDLFWFFFVPCTVFCLRYLPAIKRNKDEDTDTFARRVEAAIGKRLGIECTKFTIADKTELEKKLMRPPAPVRASPTRSHIRPINLELQRMVAQVAEVLPYVPSDVVLKDLVRTHSVDITISNILEGHIPYVPIPATPPSVPQQSKVSSQPMPQPSIVTSTAIGQSSSFDTSAPTFAKSAQERNMSFHERKTRLIENARRRYVEKHGVTLAGLSSVKFG